MGIDKETKPKYIHVVFPENKELLQLFRNKAQVDGQNDDLDEDKEKKMSISDDLASFEVEEYYFDEHEGTIEFSGQLDYGLGEKTWFSFSIPLSDIVLIDIIQFSLKKLSKLKTALETLK